MRPSTIIYFLVLVLAIVVMCVGVAGSLPVYGLIALLALGCALDAGGY